MKSRHHKVLENKSSHHHVLSTVHEPAHIRNKPSNKKMATVVLVLLIFSTGSAADQAQLTIAEYNLLRVLSFL
jgi:hypothetical protein